MFIYSIQYHSSLFFHLQTCFDLLGLISISIIWLLDMSYKIPYLFSWNFFMTFFYESDLYSLIYAIYSTAIQKHIQRMVTALFAHGQFGNEKKQKKPNFQPVGELSVGEQSDHDNKYIYIYIWEPIQHWFDPRPDENFFK